MHYQALATDFDGTLAHKGRVDDATLAALGRLRAAGRRLVLVTGRELPEWLGIFHHARLFDRVVAENGALLYRPADGSTTALAAPPSPAFIAALRARGVAPLAVGQVIVATRRDQQPAVQAVLAETHAALQIILNKEAVMILPPGVDKATGLAAALAELAIEPGRVVGVGDGENDRALLEACGCGVAVANAVPDLLASAQVVTRGERGAGVVELIDRLLAGDLPGPEPAG